MTASLESRASLRVGVGSVEEEATGFSTVSWAAPRTSSAASLGGVSSENSTVEGSYGASVSSVCCSTCMASPATELDGSSGATASGSATSGEAGMKRDGPAAASAASVASTAAAVAVAAAGGELSTVNAASISRWSGPGVEDCCGSGAGGVGTLDEAAAARRASRGSWGGLSMLAAGSVGITGRVEVLRALVGTGSTLQTGVVVVVVAEVGPGQREGFLAAQLLRMLSTMHIRRPMLCPLNLHGQ